MGDVGKEALLQTFTALVAGDAVGEDRSGGVGIGRSQHGEKEKDGGVDLVKVAAADRDVLETNDRRGGGRDRDGRSRWRGCGGGGV